MTSKLPIPATSRKGMYIVTRTMLKAVSSDGIGWLLVDASFVIKLPLCVVSLYNDLLNNVALFIVALYTIRLLIVPFDMKAIFHILAGIIFNMLLDCLICNDKNIMMIMISYSDSLRR